ncbi:hypothetical protein OBBRIDRAFT_423816 [Obba rivulosa]|uniref:Uncharacterized protein n=1 Tax=Obba rivulosa TaxID=1052685 RepID=A0A8E2B2W1_9APHY|nr:hypothetical protein OBBRIDRAFT_423816 [Obba rivulosa]
MKNQTVAGTPVLVEQDALGTSRPCTYIWTLLACLSSLSEPSKFRTGFSDEAIPQCQQLKDPSGYSCKTLLICTNYRPVYYASIMNGNDREISPVTSVRQAARYNSSGEESRQA